MLRFEVIVDDETLAAEQHELRTFRLGRQKGSEAECWCGWYSEEYLEQAAARRAHERHQEDEKRWG